MSTQECAESGTNRGAIKNLVKQSFVIVGPPSQYLVLGMEIRNSTTPTQLRNPRSLQLPELGNLQELGALVLVLHSQELVGLHQVGQVGGNFGHQLQHGLARVAAVESQGVGPHRVEGAGSVQEEERQAETGRGQERAGHSSQVTIQQTNLQRELKRDVRERNNDKYYLGKRMLQHVNLASLGVTPEHKEVSNVKKNEARMILPEEVQ